MLFVTALMTYSRMNYELVSEDLKNALPYLPVLLIGITILVSVYFNKAKVLLLTFTVALYLFSQPYINGSSQQLVLLSLLIPVLILTIVLLPVYGIFSVKSIPLYVIYLVSVLAFMWIDKNSPMWVTEFIQTSILPEKYFDWSILPQLLVILHLFVFLFVFSIWIYKQDTLFANALGIYIFLLLAIYMRSQGKDMVILMSGAMLLNLFSILKDSWSMAYLDELTQLPGRRALNEKLAGLVGIYTIAMVDIDFFKKFNDKYGHDVGDDALKMVASKLKSSINGGIVYRFGGEEFCIVFGNKDLSLVKEILENVRQQIEQSKFIVNRGKDSKAKKSVPITISIGAADSVQINSSTDVLKKADKALYKAKQKGRNCVVF